MPTKNKVKSASSILTARLGRLSLGKLIRSIRLGEDETQDVFAERLGISKQQLSDIENNRKAVSPKSAAQYAEFLGYSTEQFIKLSIQDGLQRNGLMYDVDLSPIKQGELK
jgi:transcriptional regulator with XRE-family HTH domain